MEHKHRLQIQWKIEHRRNAIGRAGELCQEGHHSVHWKMEEWFTGDPKGWGNKSPARMEIYHRQTANVKNMDREKQDEIQSGKKVWVHKNHLKHRDPLWILEKICPPNRLSGWLLRWSIYCDKIALQTRWTQRTQPPTWIDNWLAYWS